MDGTTMGGAVIAFTISLLQQMLPAAPVLGEKIPWVHLTG